MNKKFGCLIVVFTVLCALFFYCNVSFTRGDFKVSALGTFGFVGNDVDSNGVLWAGDKNWGLYKSIDNCSTFQLVYTLPHEPPTANYPNPYSGLVWTVFVDSRGYIFTSGGGANNSLYRSTNAGANFTAVLNANETSNRSFYISMTEDNSGNLYTVTYTVGFAQPIMLKSTNGGTSWTKIGSFSIFHFHAIKFNPANGYLYAVTGERSGSLSNCNDSEKIFRSKDLGATWSLVVDRNDAVGTVYLPIAFVGNYVYVGQDYPNKVCQIHRFYDDGKGPFVPQVVYTPPDSYMPFVSGMVFNNSLVFADTAEAQDGTTRIVTSVDGVNWVVLNSMSVLSTDNRWNFLTVHPRSNIIFGTMKAGYTYQIKDVPPITPAPTPTATPTPSPTPSPTPQPTPTPTPSPSPTPSETPQPTPETTPTPDATPTPTTQSTTFTLTGTVSSSTAKPKATPTPKPSPAPPTPSPTAPSTPVLSPSATASGNNSGIDEVAGTAMVVLMMIGGTVIFMVSLKHKSKVRNG